VWSECRWDVSQSQRFDESALTTTCTESLHIELWRWAASRNFRRRCIAIQNVDMPRCFATSPLQNEKLGSPQNGNPKQFYNYKNVQQYLVPIAINLRLYGVKIQTRLNCKLTSGCLTKMDTTGGPKNLFAPVLKVWIYKRMARLSANLQNAPSFPGGRYKTIASTYCSLRLPSEGWPGWVDLCV